MVRGQDCKSNGSTRNVPLECKHKHKSNLDELMYTVSADLLSTKTFVFPRFILFGPYVYQNRCFIILVYFNKTREF